MSKEGFGVAGAVGAAAEAEVDGGVFGKGPGVAGKAAVAERDVEAALRAVEAGDGARVEFDFLVGAVNAALGGPAAREAGESGDGGIGPVGGHDNLAGEAAIVGGEGDFLFAGVEGGDVVAREKPGPSGSGLGEEKVVEFLAADEVSGGGARGEGGLSGEVGTVEDDAVEPFVDEGAARGIGGAELFEFGEVLEDFEVDPPAAGFVAGEAGAVEEEDAAAALSEEAGAG